MRYLDKYPDCKGCPVYKYCGTMVGSIKLCNSYDSQENLEEEYLQHWLKEEYEAFNKDYYNFLAEEIELEEIVKEEDVDYWVDYWNDIKYIQEP